MRIAVTGAKGQLGTALQHQLAQDTLLLLDLPECDITNAAQIRDTLVSFAPDVVIHPAAMTNVDACEADPDAAYRTNALGSQNVALACRECSAAMVYISTDHVFDGSKGAPYYEWDAPNPLNVYARSKLAGEWATQTLAPRFYVVRTAWLYTPGGRNFVQSVIRLAKEKGALTMVTDEVGSPTYAPDLAAALAQLIQTEFYGIYHFTDRGVCSRYDWAREILRLAGLQDVPVTPSQDYVRAARVPKHVELHNFCGAQQLGLTFRPWQEALADYFKVGQ
jgi:dTDP-4-dehydrorhamnose reductase